MISKKLIQHFSTIKNPKTQVFMLNLGGPESVEQITPFLQRLFSDTTVIRIPFGLGKYIGKFRGPAKVQKQYEEIGGGSPIRKWTEIQGNKMLENLQQQSSDEFLQQHGPFSVTPSFRYSDPLYDDTLKDAIQNNPDLERIVLYSQYPQWSCSTSGNSIREALKVIRSLGFDMKNVSIIDRWYNNPLYVNAMAEILYEDITKNFDEQQQNELVILFSAHSLPKDFVQQGDPYNLEIGTTANLVIQQVQEKLGKNNIPFRVVWQSKVGFQEWLKPNTEDAIEHYSKFFKNAIVVPLGFAQDHLETLYELDLEYIKAHSDKYNKIFRGRSLNDNPHFINALSSILKDCLSQENQYQQYPSPNFSLRCPECFCKDDCKNLNDYLDVQQQK